MIVGIQNTRHLMLLGVLLGFLALACNAGDFTRQDVLDVYAEEYPEAVAYGAQLLDCNQNQLQVSVSECIATITDDPVLREQLNELHTCLLQATDDASAPRELICYETFTEKRASAEETAEDEEVAAVEESADPAGTLTLTSYEVTLNECLQNPSGHFFDLACNFTLTVVAEYEVGTTPASFFCQLGGVTNRTAASAELTEPSGTVTLTMGISSIRVIYSDGDGNGAADAPGADNTNPAPEEDGQYAPLRCYIGPAEYSYSSTWGEFSCEPPEVTEEGCLAPWLDLTGGHTQD